MLIVSKKEINFTELTKHHLNDAETNENNVSLKHSL